MRYPNRMAVTLPLDEMTNKQKLEAMELLWEDLAGSPEALESPDWHREILDERRKRVVDGTARFLD